MVPPLPREASVIRHTSVRGLKRQSDERKRDRESGQYVVNGDCKVGRRSNGLVCRGSVCSDEDLQVLWLQADLRSYLSEPELPAVSHHDIGSEVDYQYFQSKGTSTRTRCMKQEAFRCLTKTISY